MRSSPLNAAIHTLDDDSLQYEGIDQGALGGERQLQRYASFSCNVIRLRVIMSNA